MCGIRGQVAAEALLRRAVEVVVRRDQLLELRLDVDEFGEVVLDERDARVGQVLDEADFAGVQDEEGFALAVGATGCTADTVDVVAGLIWGIELDDPVNSWDLAVVSMRTQHICIDITYIESTRSDISANKHTLSRIDETEEVRRPLLLLLLAVQRQDWEVDVVEQLLVVLHAVTARNKDNDLLLLRKMLLQHCK